MVCVVVLIKVDTSVGLFWTLKSVTLGFILMFNRKRNLKAAEHPRSVRL